MKIEALNIATKPSPIFTWEMYMSFYRTRTLRPCLAQLPAPDSQAESGKLCQTLQNQEK
jgi:hypothetical protein